MKPYVLRVFPGLPEASDALAAEVAKALREALTSRGAATLAVPGGTTPGRFLATLGALPLDWSRVTLLPTDERCVAVDDARSNERMIRESFAPLRDGVAGWCSLAGGPDPEAAAAALAAKVEALGPLDVVVSGMGADAHVASLFPGDPQAAVLRGPSVVPARPANLEPRLSLSRSVLTEAGFAALLIGGEAKRLALEAAGEGDELARPVSLFFGRAAPLQVFWSET